MTNAEFKRMNNFIEKECSFSDAYALIEHNISCYNCGIRKQCDNYMLIARREGKRVYCKDVVKAYIKGELA